MNEILNPHDLSNQGSEAYARGEYPQAASLFIAAAEGYRSLDKMGEAGEMLNNACVAFLQAGQGEEALKVVSPTIEMFEKINDRRRLGMAYGNLAAALEACHRYEEAIPAYQTSARYLNEAGEDDLSIEAMKSLSALQLKMGKQIEAVMTMQSALSGVKKPTLKQRILKKLLRTP